MLNSIIENNTITINSMIICMISAIILGVVIAIVHKSTSKYSKNFLITLGVLPLLVQSVIMLVNGNLGTSVAVLGSFSLVRFRSMPGNSKEIISVFFAMAVGVAIGVGYIAFAAVLTVIVSLLMIILSKSSFGEPDKRNKKLKITIPENLDYTQIFDEIFGIYLTNCELEKVKTTNLGSMYELTYDVEISKDVNEKKFIDELRERNGNLPILLQREIVGNMEL